MLEGFASPTRWTVSHKADRFGCSMADRHYSRRKVGAPQFMPPGDTIVLVWPEGPALWGWWRANPASGIPQMNGKSGWTCVIYRNESPVLSSLLILEAEVELARAVGEDCGPDGMMTYVEPRKIRSVNPGCCFQKAGWKKTGWSADKRKRLLAKPFDRAGQS